MTVATETGVPLEQQDWFERIRQNSRALLTGGLAVVLVGGGAWVYIASQQRKEAFASQELSRARSAAESGNLPLASSDLARIAERFGGTRAADDAVILLNQIRLVQGQQQVAAEALDAFVAGRHPDYAKAAAYGLLGGAREDLGQAAAAATAYAQAARLARLDFLKAQYLLDAARASVAAGDSAGARAHLADLLEHLGDLDQAAEARLRMAELGGEVPPAPPRREN